MSRAADCGLDQALFPSEFLFNEIGAILATFFLVLTSCVYIWNIFTVTTSSCRSQPKQKRLDLAINPFSGLLASVAGIVLIFATWPQPLEGAALLIVALAQATVLGWQDHNPEAFWKDLIEKLPDVAAVVVAAYALRDGRQRYLELNKDKGVDGFQTDHDPTNQEITAYVLTGAGFIVGTFQELCISKERSTGGKNKILMISSILFCAAQVSTTVTAMYFGQTTLADGCALFNTTKLCAIVTLCLGDAYSLIICIRKPYRYRSHEGSPIRMVPRDP